MNDCHMIEYGKHMIGPHNYKELELMLAGLKPMARFTIELDFPETGKIDQGFDQHVKSGKIKKYYVKSTNGLPTERRYYYLEGEEWRVKTCELMWACIGSKFLSAFTPDDLHRLDGWLLGYAKEDIEDFIQQSNARKTNKKF